MKAPLAAVTMVYNEPEFLPVWLGYYAQMVGRDHCFVIDHGTDDGSTDTLACNRLRIPRSPQDDARRARAIGRICAGLLEWYEHVLYCDVDEIVVADPVVFPSVTSLARARRARAVTATGFDIIHRPDCEPPLDFTAPIARQRVALRFSAAMCKPCLIGAPVRWSPGFHSVEALPPRPDPALMLFHLRYVDRDKGLVRLARTRNQPWVSPDAGSHQRMENSAWSAMLQSMAGLAFEPASLLEDDPAVSLWRQRIEDEGRSRAEDPYPLDLGLSGDRLWRLPERFRPVF
ncbi:glycosyltransferase family 2 protein [Swaminathania salitolerans]|uniref:Glycosyl transferase family 2 n=1 Tax=Swaminathania salitolerans TaxID=182838 RepID=A0A511BP35_9PROT|nr:glycosyltransferase family 2 protein [Swaminathania salitolerans]GBQ10623.1 hypothetical protein AA21291_0498 [Swaminathania salitolerans LMG 21291]GEL02106.1 hypothetical protein SSA02_12690 [Swaminathania salitolerans]